MSFLQRGLKIKTADICNKYPSLFLTSSGSYFFSTKSPLKVQPVNNKTSTHIAKNSHEHDQAKVKLDIFFIYCIS